ncbi:MAG: hypothetical protein ACE5I1_05010 [bacterium]
MNKKKAIIVFGFALLVFGFTLAQDLVWQTLNFKYDSGKARRHSVGDTLIGTGQDMIYFGTDADRYPMAVSFNMAVKELNNADTLTARLDPGAFGEYESGVLDTFVCSTDSAWSKTYWFDPALATKSDAPASDWRLVITGLQDATDSLTYRIVLRAAYQQ